MTNDNNDTPDARYIAEIEQLTKMVDTGSELVAEGNEISLANLEAAVADLCLRMADDPPTESDAIVAAIETLVTRLNKLGEALQQQNAQRH